MQLFKDLNNTWFCGKSEKKEREKEKISALRSEFTAYERRDADSVKMEIF
jgi:hypothetical protein